MSFIGRLGWLVLLIPCLSLIYAQKEMIAQPWPWKPLPEVSHPWNGKLADGRQINKGELDKIIQEHRIWQETFGKKGKQASLKGAELNRADLSGADLGEANLSGAHLRGANLARANFNRADLAGADLAGAYLSGSNLNKTNLSISNLHEADLSGADLGGANLSKANLEFANLSGADIKNADLSGTNLIYTDVTGAIFEPKAGTLPGASSLLGIKGVSSLKFHATSSYGLVELREIYKKAGMITEEREVTFSLEHTRRVKLWEAKGILPKVESLLRLVFFEWTCQYGMSPWRPLMIMGGGIFFFTFSYLIALRSRKRKNGIWLLILPDRVLSRKLTEDRPFKLTFLTPFKALPLGRWDRLGVQFWRGWRGLRLAFYFSLLSATRLGWRELNVGTWISRLQKYEYNLQASGWVRSFSGFQSLLSVYMLALWALTYFGRPFE